MMSCVDLLSEDPQVRMLVISGVYHRDQKYVSLRTGSKLKSPPSETWRGFGRANVYEAWNFS